MDWHPTISVYVFVKGLSSLQESQAEYEGEQKRSQVYFSCSFAKGRAQDYTNKPDTFSCWLSVTCKKQ